jgi:hypothetical protein
MNDMPLKSVMTCLIAKKSQILIFKLSLNILCVNILIYCTFYRQKKVVTFFSSKSYEVIFYGKRRSSHFFNQSKKSAIN